MKLERVVLSVFLLAIVVLEHHHVGADTDGERKLYIVYMGGIKQIQTQTKAMEVHQSIISDVILDEEVARQSLIHSFGRSFDGFVAYLRPEEAAKLKEKNGVVSVFPNTKYKLHTTETWDYLGLNGIAKRVPTQESDTIVGLLDTGIYIQAPSFNDRGYGPPPSKWKGKCQKGADFPGCNNKVIGARAYKLTQSDCYRDGNGSSSEQTPADYIGHGSHTSSTAAGSVVAGASFYGIGAGTARGGVPSARIAMYKVCDVKEGCSSAALLAGFDDAIADGVDIISVSIGGPSVPFVEDTIAIGAFHAMKNGIFTSCSAGNEHNLASSTNGAPWILTVAASFGDRVFKTPILLGDKTEILGDSLNPTGTSEELYPIINVGSCHEFDYSKIKGKIVYCDSGEQNSPQIVKGAGGKGIIMTCPQELYNMGPALPGAPWACLSTKEDIATFEKYINSTKNPHVGIQMTKSVFLNAPTTVAYFSSRGPDINALSLLKPDISAPGVNILAAYTELTTEDTLENKTTTFGVLSGTSMSCPHTAAVAAYVKTFHPDWSPAAIKSAIMTTAKDFISTDIDYDMLAYGAGQIDPLRAVDPGLVYDLNENDYLGYLCQNGYNSSSLTLMAGEKVDCSKISVFGGQDQLNYPSMALRYTENITSAVFKRSVKNVGGMAATFTATVDAPGFSVTVKPDKLEFKEANEILSFTVEVQVPPMKNQTFMFSGSLVWSDGPHTVKSPIFVYSLDLAGSQNN